MGLVVNGCNKNNYIVSKYQANIAVQDSVIRIHQVMSQKRLGMGAHASRTAPRLVFWRFVEGCAAGLGTLLRAVCLVILVILVFVPCK